MIELQADAFLAGMAKLAATLPDVVAEYAGAVAEDGLRDLGATSSFQNRTFALREAFSQAGDANERRIFIDPSAAPRKGKTPPATYGAYLNDGTSRISPRRFMEHAGEVVTKQSVTLADLYLGNWING
jgi:hypothetical protein